MSAEELIYFAAILFVAATAALRFTAIARFPWRRPQAGNPTALAMVITWAICRLLYWWSGEAMPLQASVLSDVAVVAAIYCKREWRRCSYETIRLQMAALWRERSPWDRAILTLFPLVWLFYAPVVDPQTQYWTLWSLSMAQLALAWLEPLYDRRGLSANMPRADAAERPPPRLDFRAPVRGRSYG